MSHHWHDWQYATFHIRGGAHKHRVALMIEAERISYEDFQTITEGRTACGKAIKNVHELSPNPPDVSAYESYMSGWRPCLRCFPAFDAHTFNRMQEIERRSWDRGELASDRASHWLYRIVSAHRSSTEQSTAAAAVAS